MQISTESSIRAAQERSKKEVSGRLKEIAYEKIDAQTEALISMIGENQVDYRFFIGFKLILNEQEVTIKSVGKEAANAFSDFIHDVNHKLMGDFVSMSNDEIWRFSKMEKLLENKISRRFKIRRLDKDDFGYLIEHLYGQTGTAYEITSGLVGSEMCIRDSKYTFFGRLCKYLLLLSSILLYPK